MPPSPTRPPHPPTRRATSPVSMFVAEHIHAHKKKASIHHRGHGCNVGAGTVQCVRRRWQARVPQKQASKTNSAQMVSERWTAVYVHAFCIWSHQLGGTGERYLHHVDQHDHLLSFISRHVYMHELFVPIYCTAANGSIAILARSHTGCSEVDTLRRLQWGSSGRGNELARALVPRPRPFPNEKGELLCYDPLNPTLNFANSRSKVANDHRHDTIRFFLPDFGKRNDYQHHNVISSRVLDAFVLVRLHAGLTGRLE